MNNKIKKHNISIKDAEKIVDDAKKLLGFDFNIKSRKRKYTEPRHILMCFLYEKSKLTLQDIGNIFNKNHATVVHSCKYYPFLIENDKSLISRNKELILFLDKCDSKYLNTLDRKNYFIVSILNKLDNKNISKLKKINKILNY